VAAGKEQSQALVLDRPGRLVGRVVVLHECRLLLDVSLLLAAEPVDRTVACGGGEPAAGVGRHAGLRPLFERDHKRLARRVLGDVDVTEAADEGGNQPAVLLTEDLLDGRRGVLHG
jgi:hypothetical protein